MGRAPGRPAAVPAAGVTAGSHRWPRGYGWFCLLLFLVACRQAPVREVDAVKLLVRRDGLYRVSLNALQDAGLHVSALAGQGLALSQGGEPVPFLVQDEQLLFYGQATHSRYTAFRPYLLRQGTAGRQMRTREVGPTGRPVAGRPVTRTLDLEENLLYLGVTRKGSSGEPWYWARIAQAGRLALDFNLRAPSDGGGRLQLVLYGLSHNPGTNPDHSLTLTVNGWQSGAIRWEGQGAYTATVRLPANTLHAGPNRLTLENVPESYLDLVAVDRLRLRYRALPEADADDTLAFAGADETLALSGFSGKPLLLDLANPARPRLLAGWRWGDGQVTLTVDRQLSLLAVGPGGFRSPAAIVPLEEIPSWRDRGQQADLIIVTSRALAPALAPLVAARQAQGLRVAVVPLAEIYDTFGFGEASPDSIRAFLTYAYREWSGPAPRYLLLVGDASTDYRGYLSAEGDDEWTRRSTMLPPYLVPTRFGGESVSDARLADVDGDLQPELAVGRWPVSTVEATADLVARTLAYEAQTAGTWAVFAGDGSDPAFPSLNQRLRRQSRLPADGVRMLASPSAAALLAAWNEGPWLLTYSGHGSLNRWGAAPLFTAETLDRLRPGTPAPIVLQLTCLTGLFAHPQQRSLAEEILAHPKGPVLTVAATGLTTADHQEPFAARFLQAVSDPDVHRVGDALLAAQTALDVSDEGLREVGDTFALLGDPSTPVGRPPTPGKP